MAQQHGHATTGVDAYGNPVPVDGGGAPVAGTGGQFQPGAAAEQRPRGILHRSSSSSSSSSSEDDGMSGRRKKGIKQKIKEKLPGAHKERQPAATTATGAYGQPQGHAGTAGKYGQQGHAGANTTTYGTTAGTYGQPHAGATGTYSPVGAHGATGQKKGIVDKIKEKLPGHH